MLFRNSDGGSLVEINRHDYKNDYIYYNKIMKIKHVLNTNTNINDTNIAKNTYSKQAISRLLEETL